MYFYWLSLSPLCCVLPCLQQPEFCHGKSTLLKSIFMGFLVSLGILPLLVLDLCPPTFSLDILNFAWLGQWCFSITYLRGNSIISCMMFFKNPITKHFDMCSPVSKLHFLFICQLYKVFIFSWSLTTSCRKTCLFGHNIYFWLFTFFKE